MEEVMISDILGTHGKNISWRLRRTPGGQKTIQKTNHLITEAKKPRRLENLQETKTPQGGQENPRRLKNLRRPR
jgi:hypothetical protein